MFQVGQHIAGRDVTTYAEHTGSVVTVTPSAHYADGTPREYRYTIRDDQTGRTHIMWQGTERID